MVSLSLKSVKSIELSEEKPLFLQFQEATSKPDNSQYGRDFARRMLDGLHATFRKFPEIKKSGREDLVAELILRWRILKDAGMPKANDDATKRLLKYDRFLVQWLHNKEKMEVV